MQEACAESHQPDFKDTGILVKGYLNILAKLVIYILLFFFLV